MKKIISLISLFVIIINILCTSTVNAQKIEKIYYKINYRESQPVINAEGLGQTNPYITYGENSDGIAYCLNPYKQGANLFQSDYYVKPIKKLENIKIWRVITNGYPIKTLEELNCLTKEEAYEATHEAIHCVIGFTNFDDISAKQSQEKLNENSTIKESGQRVVNAIKQILENAEKSAQNPPSTEYKISSENWENIKENNIEYISKKYKIQSDIMIGKYTINLNGTYPENTKIVNLENKSVNSFENGSYFKILIPKENIKSDLNFTFDISANLKTLAVYDAYPKDIIGFQNYGMVVPIEEIIHTENVKYEIPKGHITINKVDAETGEKMPNAIFSILDKNEKEIKNNLITDESGCIKIDDLIPSTYYLKEVQAPQGYSRIKENIKFNLMENEYLSINVRNSKIKKIENTINTGEINISTKHEENVDNINNFNQNIEENESEKNINRLETVIHDSINKYVEQRKEDNKSIERNDDVKINNNNISNTEIKENNVINNENYKNDDVKISSNSISNTETKENNVTNREIYNNVDENNLIEKQLKQKQENMELINSMNMKILPLTGM